METKSHFFGLSTECVAHMVEIQSLLAVDEIHQLLLLRPLAAEVTSVMSGQALALFYSPSSWVPLFYFTSCLFFKTLKGHDRVPSNVWGLGWVVSWRAEQVQAEALERFGTVQDRSSHRSTREQCFNLVNVLLVSPKLISLRRTDLQLPKSLKILFQKDCQCINKCYTSFNNWWPYL